MLKRELKTTADGSKTLYIPDWNESYHSKHGALQEAIHVFIKNGIENFKSKKQLNILEYGFGTGLNTLLTLIYCENNKIEIFYSTLEKFPIESAEINAMDFDSIIPNDKNVKDFYLNLHDCAWETENKISDWFSLTKIQDDFRKFIPEKESLDIVFYDAFGMRVQPELWSEEVFEKTFYGLKKGGLLTTYACNGATKRALKAVGFEIEKLAGPPGKREMINAWKR